jgi:cyclin-Q
MTMLSVKNNSIFPVKPSTYAYAASIFHRVIKNLAKSDYDKFSIATGAIYLASKVNEDPIRLKDAINVSQVTLDKDGAMNQLGNDNWFHSIRDSVVQCELFIMRILHFDPSVKLPHPVSLIFMFCSTFE